MHAAGFASKTCFAMLCQKSTGYLLAIEFHVTVGLNNLQIYHSSTSSLSLHELFSITPYQKFTNLAFSSQFFHQLQCLFVFQINF